MCRKCRDTFPMDQLSIHDCIGVLHTRICALEDKVEYLLSKDLVVEDKEILKPCNDGTHNHEWLSIELDDQICQKVC